uniref:Protein Wnt n=1 Tax=Dendrocoelum lacteum TaxID=27895 RepID=T1D117_9PLAT
MDFIMIWRFIIIIILYNLVYVTTFIISIPSTWWNIEVLPWKIKSQNSESSVRETQHTCLKLSGYSYSQATMCAKYFDHMPAVTIGARIGIEECQRQLKYRHWNCSTPHNSDIYGSFTYVSTKEAAFAHAISNAGVVHAIARSCKEARLSTCGCSTAERPKQLHRDWIWGGCGDNLKYAYWFAKNFIDMREKESSFPRASKELANILVNLHNNKAGRMAVFKMSSVACKCHGVSGSCSLRSCWKQLPPFIQIGHHITQKYDMAKRVKFNRRGTRLRKISGRPIQPAANELIYSEKSPDYCELSKVQPGFITSGRECRLDRKGVERCELLCCNRSYRTYTREVHEKCHCKFIWCCKIQCQVCIRLEQVHVCN